MPTQTQEVTAPVLGEINFYAKLIEAISRANSSMVNQQLTDAQTTQLDAGLETDVFAYFTGANGPLQKAADKIAAYAKKLANASKANPPLNTNQRNELSGQINKWQTNFQAAQTRYQGAQSQYDSLVQQSQGATGQDSTYQKQVIEFVSAMVQIGSYLSNILASR